MVVSQMDCCAFAEISDLSDHSSAPEAMRAFCQNVYPAFQARGVKAGAFYIFTAVVKTTRPNDMSAKIPYGDRFAAFIRKNGLGKVIETVPQSNRRNNPQHTIRGWVWCPNDKNLRKWWNKQCSLT